MKKNKLFIKLSLIFALIFYIAYIYLPFFVVEAVYLSNKKISDFPISIDKITISPTLSCINLEDITIKNRTYYSKKELLKIGTLTIKIKPFSIFSKNLIFDEISASRIHLTWEDKNGNINLYDLKNRLQQNISNKKNKKSKNIIIKKLSLYNMRVSVLSKIFNRKKDNIKIPDINLKNIIKTSSETTINTLSEQLLTIFINEIKNSVLNNKHIIKKIEKKVLNHVKKNLIKKLLKF